MGDVRRGGHHADAVGALRLKKGERRSSVQCSGYVHGVFVFVSSLFSLGFNLVRIDSLWSCMVVRRR
jgi:hypothetical protein